MLEPLATYAAEARFGNLESFKDSFPDVILIIDPFTAAEDEESGFLTLSGANARRPDLQSTVAPVKKRAGANAFGSMVTVGRAPNNDIAIPAVVISKFHAYFMVNPDGTYTITDAGSTNGTTVNGRRLAPKTERVKVDPGDEVAFGELRTKFFTPEAAWPYLRSLAPTPARTPSPPDGASVSWQHKTPRGSSSLGAREPD